MAILRGKADGQRINEILKKKLQEIAQAQSAYKLLDPKKGRMN